jgi:hypothetical protein
MRENITILMRYNNGNLMSVEEEIIYKSPSLQNSDESKFAKGGEVGSIDFSDFSFDTDGDYEDRDVEEEKIKYLRTKIDFDKVRGYIDYRKEKNNTYLRFFKNGELVMRISGDGNPNGVNAEITAYGNIGYLNYHPQDGFGGLNMIEFKREVSGVFEDFEKENQQFAKGGQFKTKNFRKIEKIDYRGKDENIKEEKWKVLVVPDAFLEKKKMKSAYFNVYAEDEKHAKAFAIYLYSKKYNVSQEHLSIEIAQPYSHLNRFQIKNQYAGKTAEEIWNAMSLRQKEHFLKDHRVVCELTLEEIKELYWLTWNELNDSPMKNNVVQAFTEHINEGQYAKGGEVDELKVGDIVTHKKGREYGHGRIYKMSSIGIYLEDKYGNKREQPFLSPSDFKKVKKMFAKGGEVANYYVVSAKENKVVSKGYSSEEDAKKEMYRLFEQTGDITYATRKMAKGGKIGFEGLAKKVAKRYVGRKVSKEYQAEYGKTYDAKEAKEVGNKVAGKVYQQQVAKKKIVRKLQRKTK